MLTFIEKILFILLVVVSLSLTFFGFRRLIKNHSPGSWSTRFRISA